MSNTEKSLDAVQLMRSIRDQITEEIKDMTIDEQMSWLRQSHPKDPLLAKLTQRALERTAGGRR